MFSILRHPLVYKNISSEITELDEDYDASEWSYNGRNVYRGALDSTYTKNYSLDILYVIVFCKRPSSLIFLKLFFPSKV